MFLNRPIGFMALLDEESRFPKGAQPIFCLYRELTAISTGTDESFVEKLNQHLSKESAFVPSPGDFGFGIMHYAGEIFYDADEFLGKNRDTLPNEVGANPPPFYLPLRCCMRSAVSRQQVYEALCSSANPLVVDVLMLDDEDGEHLSKSSTKLLNLFK